MLEHWAHFMRKPIVQLGAAVGVIDKLNAKPNVRQRDRADVEQIERLSGDEGEDFAVRLEAAQLRKDIGIEQPTRHKEISRTGIGDRAGVRSM